MIDIGKLRRAFFSQKAGAKDRGVGWELTFDQWLQWWGDDLPNRGHGHDKLQMQRIADSGPYSLENIRKGYPRDNRRTAATVAHNEESAKAAQAFKRYLAKRPTNQDRDERPHPNKGWASTMFEMWDRFRTAEIDTKAAD